MSQPLSEQLHGPPTGWLRLVGQSLCVYGAFLLCLTFRDLVLTGWLAGWLLPWCRSLSLSMSRKGTDFDTFCTLLGVLPTGQYHKLFNLYDRDGGGYIDMKVRSSVYSSVGFRRKVARKLDKPAQGKQQPVLMPWCC